MSNVWRRGWARTMKVRASGSVRGDSGQRGLAAALLLVIAGFFPTRDAKAQAPIAGALSATVAYDSSANPITLNLSGGTPTSVAVASAASHGTATASGTSITYTPTIGFFGSDSFTYTATNGSGTSSAATASITVSAPTITVTPSVLPAGTALVAYNQSLSVSGGKAPYTFSTVPVSGLLPVGLSISSAGAITGTTAVAGIYYFTVGGTDSSTTTHASFTSGTIALVINPTVPVAPDPPTIGSATAGNAQATVTFTPPLATGGAAITSYTAYSIPGGHTGTASASPIVVTGLVNGVTYTFDVTATNSAGTSLVSALSNAVTPIAPPVAGAVSATVAYDSSANPITLNLSGGSPASVAVTSAASHGTAVASGTSITYAPNTGFFGSDSFTYTATNGSGTSSAATVTVTVSAPTITVAPATLPVGTFGSAYSQSLSASGGQAPYTFSTVVASGALPPGLSLSGSGAILGTPTAAGTYSFTVSGTDSSVTTHASFTSGTITLTINPIAPGAPTIGTATAGNAQANVIFTAPTSNGGAAISSYTVTSSPGGFTGTGSASPIVVAGLANGTSYSFTVTATNSAGTGPSSAASNAVTPQGPPVASNVSATVAYDSSANPITLSISGTTTNVAVVSAASHGTATASGASISYTPTAGYFGSDSFTYTATNGIGTSSAATVSVTISPPTIAVTPTTLPSGTALVAYSQSLSASGGQSPYTFSSVPASGLLPSGLVLSSTGAITGIPLLAGTYTFTVSGTDSSTATHATFTSGTITVVINPTVPVPPDPPIIGTAAAGNAQATVTFTPPSSNGGATITSYTVYSVPGGVTGTGATSPITVTGLTNGVQYAFTVTATNSAGTGLASALSNAVTPIAPPIAGAASATVGYDSTADPITLNLSGGVPTSVAVASAASHGTATASGTSIAYTPTTGFFGSDSFTYTATNGSGTSSAATVSVTVSAPTITVTPTTLAAGAYNNAYSQSLSANGGQSPYTFATSVASGALPPGLSLSSTGAITGSPTAAGTYSFTVSGTDSSTSTHASFTSGTITLTINPIAPGAPTIGAATAGNAQASVTFTAPTSNGGAAISSYTVTSSPGGFTGTGSSSPIIVAGLANGTTYSFTVAATNSAGTGPSSAVSNSVTPEGPPVASGVSASVAYDSSANLIALSISGTTTSVAVASAASHGTATASGTSITYTPTVGYYGSDSFTYTATNGMGTSSAATATITITAPAITVIPATLPSGTALSAYSQSLSASGGQSPYTFSTTPASGVLPSGLALSSTGAITGTPLLAGTYTFTVSGTDSSTATHASFTSGTITLVIYAAVPLPPDPPIIGTATAGNAQATVTFTPPVLNGGAPITSYTAYSIPGGFTGTASASPITVAGLTNGTTYAFNVTATNSAGTSLMSGLSNSVTPVAPPVAGAVSATVGYDTSGNPITLNLSGGAPSSVAVASAASHGTATAIGTSITYTPTMGYLGPDSFTYTATNGSGTSSPATVTINLSNPTITVTPATLADGTDGAAYSQSLSASGGQAPYTFATSVASGVLPPGLSLSSAGAVTGTPTSTGSFSFTVSGTDSSSGTHASFTSGTITVTIHAGTPGAPTIGAATAGNAQATVSFTPPSSDGGAAITSYTVTSSPGGFTGAGASSPITVSGLANGTSYTFTVTATNSVGTGPASAPSNAVTPRASQTITFNNPGTQSFSSSPTLTATASSGLTPTFTSMTTSVCTITSGGALTFVSAGTCTIAADQSGNASYAAAPEVTQSFTVTAVAPGAPTIGTAVSGNGQASVSFAAPASNGGTPITSYTVTSSPGGFTATGSGSPIVVTGLANGTTYTFTVTATNAVGTSAASGVSNPVTPTSAAQAGAVSATVAYDSSADPITLNLSGGAPTSVAVASPASHGTATASGTSISYTPTMGYFGADSFTYTATNGMGTSSPATVSITVSAPVISVTPTTLASGTVGSVYSQTLSATGGAPPYTFSTNVASGALPTGLALSSSGAITGTPTAACACTFTVSGTDSSTATHASFTSSTISLTVAAILPGAPTIGSATPGNAQATVSFTPPASSGGGTITSYTVTSSPGGLTGSGPASPITVTGLTNGTSYTFTVTATNSAGTGPASAPSNAITPAALPVAGSSSATVAYNSNATPIPLNLSGGAPTSVAIASAASHGTATASGTSISYTPTAGFFGSDSFTYTATNGTGTSPAGTVSITISAPTITISPTTLASGTYGTPYSQSLLASGGQAPYTFATTPASGSLPAGITLASSGAITGTPTAAGTYTFTVSGTDSSTPSPAPFTSASITLTIGAILPGAPIVGTATAGNAQATVTFTPPSSLGGDAIVRHTPFQPELNGSGSTTTYTATSSPGGVTGSSTSSPILVTGLTNGTTYTFTIAATNSAGTGPSSAPTNAVTPQGSQTITFANPGPQVYGSTPTVTATASSGLAVSFSSSTTGVCTVTSGGVLSFVAAGTCSLNANQSGNAAYQAAPQVSQSFNVAAVVPGQPTVLGAAAGNGQSTVSFAAPASNGGAPITGYTVTSSPGGITATGAASPITIGGLANGTAYTFTVTATNSAGTGPSSAPSNPVTPSANVTATQTVASTSLTQNHAATPFTPVVGGSGAAPLSYTVAPALPAGLSLAAATGTISGTPTAQSPATTYTVTVTDANGATSTATFSLTVNGPVTETQSSAPPTLTQGVAATPFTPITGSGGTAPLTYSVSPTLPVALMISPTTGQITGTPTAASAATTYTVTVTDANGATSTATFSLTVTGQLLAAAKSVTAAYNANGTTSTAIDLSSSITGGTATSVAVVTQPSHGVATASGLGVSYLPTIGFHGSDSFTYTASGGGVTSAAATVSITVSAPSISVGPAILPGGAVGVAYLQSLVPNGGAAPYLFSTTPASGTLPAGLTITSGGVLSGTPTTACVCTFTISGTDSSVGGAVSFTSPTISLTIVAGAPTVLGVTPAIGLAAGGTVVSVSGTNFTDTSVVSFGSAPATTVTYVSPTELTATAPAGTGTVDVVVATAGGASAASVLDQFTYLAQPAALSDPVGTAVDDSGNLFIADASLGYLVEVPAGCQALNCEEVIGGGFAGLTGVAVDGNGSLYALSGGANGTVTRLTWNAATSSYVAQTTIATGLVLPDSAPTGIAVDDLGNLYVTDTANHRVVEEPWIAASNSYGAPVVLATGSATSAPSGIAVDGNGDVFIADPGTQTIEELTPAGLLAGAAPTILATGVNAQSITIDASGDLYYSDSVANTITKIPWSGSSYATPVVIATSLNAPEGLSVDDSGNLLVANNATKSVAKVSVDTPPSLHFANTKVGATSTDSPQVATLANIGTAALTFLATSGTNPLIPAGFALDHAATCPEVFSTSASQTLAEGASCTYAIDFSPGEASIGSDAGPLLATDDNLNLSGATQSIALSGTAIADDASSVTLTLNPASPIVFGKAIAIDAVVRDTTVPATVPTGSIGFTLTNSASVESSISTPIALNGGSASVAGFTPQAAGSYTIAGNYTGVVGDIAASTGSIALTVTKATPMLSYAPSPATQAYGTGIPATALDATAVDSNGAAIPGSFVYTTTVNSVATTLAAGSTVLPAATYTITATFTPADAADFVAGGTVSAAYSVTQKTATVTLGSLNQSYTGKPHEATVVTSPADLDVTFTYNGSAVPPVSAGSYAVVATILDTDYVGSATGALVIAKAAPDAVSLSSSSNPVLTQNAVTFTATVSSALSVPTGTVAFFDSTTGTALGKAALANGVAMLTTSSLAVGGHSITATYQGDIDFLALASAPLAQTVLDFSVSISSTPGSSPTVTADPGGNAAYEFTLSPTGSSNFTDPVTFTVTGLPPGATYTITPSTIPAGAVATNVTLTITLPQSVARSQHSGRRLLPVVFALLLLPFAGCMRSAGKRFGLALHLVVFVVGAGITAGLTGCGTNSGFFGQQPRSYTITLTATSGALSHATTVILNVP